MKRNSTPTERHRERISAERSFQGRGEPALELPARSRTRALALGKLREDGCMPSIRVVPPKYDIGPWMGIRCLFYSMELSYGSGMKIFPDICIATAL